MSKQLATVVGWLDPNSSCALPFWLRRPPEPQLHPLWKSTSTFNVQKYISGTFYGNGWAFQIIALEYADLFLFVFFGKSKAVHNWSFLALTIHPQGCGLPGEENRIPFQRLKFLLAVFFASPPEFSNCRSQPIYFTKWQHNFTPLQLQYCFVGPCPRVAVGQAVQNGEIEYCAKIVVNAHPSAHNENPR